jgi:MOSC domain-containing protein YiiM
MTLTSTIDHVFAGGLEVLQPEGQRTGMFKRRITGPARVELHGIVGDQHGDTRVHGGPEKALHHYAAQHYERLAQAFTHSAGQLVTGSLGENISARGLSECSVHIGDVFRIGSSVVQVSQPRSPCWKINHRFNAEHLSMFVARSESPVGITGFFSRVSLKRGSVRTAGTAHRTFSIDQFWRVQLSHRPVIDDLLALAAVPGLADDWQRRLTQRANWLQKSSHN